MPPGWRSATTCGWPACRSAGSTASASSAATRSSPSRRRRDPARRLVGGRRALAQRHRAALPLPLRGRRRRTSCRRAAASPSSSPAPVADIGRFFNEITPLLRAIDPEQQNRLIDALNTALVGREEQHPAAGRGALGAVEHAGRPGAAAAVGPRQRQPPARRVQRARATQLLAFLDDLADRGDTLAAPQRRGARRGGERSPTSRRSSAALIERQRRRHRQLGRPTSRSSSPSRSANSAWTSRRRSRRCARASRPTC